MECAISMEMITGEYIHCQICQTNISLEQYTKMIQYRHWNCPVCRNMFPREVVVYDNQASVQGASV